MPGEIRRALGLVAGTTVEFEMARGGVWLRKGQPAERRAVDEVFGVLKLSKRVDALLDEMRGPGPSPGRKQASAAGRNRK